MSWQTIQPQDEDRLSPRTREIISRGTLLIVSLFLMYGSYKTLTWCMRAHDEAVQTAQKNALPGTQPRVISGVAFPFIIGLALGFLGAIILLGAIMPSRFWEHFASPPGDPQEEANMLHRIIRIFWRIH